MDPSVRADLYRKKSTLDTSGWTMKAWGKSTPQQRNGHDCGVIMATTAEYLGRDAKLNFTQDDIDKKTVRRRMVYEIHEEASDDVLERTAWCQYLIRDAQ